jgi:hypothetical protein
LNSNTTGSSNTAIGDSALYANVSGSYNTASGAAALQNNVYGTSDTAVGFSALYSNTGSSNTAVGNEVLQSNSTGYDNTASGSMALWSNLTGHANTASGVNASVSNTSGLRNTAYGASALYSNTDGSYNIAVGYQAGYNLTGSNDIDIGNAGVASESGTVRIGTSGTQTAVYVAGITNSKVTGNAVYVTSTGQLGVMASSERYKTAIAPMGPATAGLQALRPVTFHLKTEPHGAIQYGLIAEEVAAVYPELVIRGESGKIEGVRYDELAPMLLNEVQQQQRALASQALAIRDIQAHLAEVRHLEQQVADLKQTLDAKAVASLLRNR